MLWAGALAVAAGTATIVASDLAALHRRAQSFGEERDTVVATRTLPLGTVIERSDLRTRMIHSSQLPEGVLGSPRDAIGRVVVVPVVHGAFVADANLAPRQREGIDGALPEGTRAMRVVVRDQLRPRAGAAVDVLASFEPSVGVDGLPTSSSDSGRAAVIAAAVIVLAVQSVQTAEGDALGVTLLVSQKEARALAFATTHGRLALALVPPEEARDS